MVVIINTSMRFGFRAMVAVCCVVGSVDAQTPLKFLGRRVTIVEPEHTDDGFPKGPAMVCLEGPPNRQCYTAPKDYGNKASAEVVELQNSEPAILFSAETGGVSGWAVHFALLGPAFEDMLPGVVSISNQNQHAFWNEPGISEQTIFLTADYVWGPDDSHYGLHRWIISAYFPGPEPDNDRYYLQDRYMTVRRYDSETQDILGSEKPEILSRLRRVKSAQ